ncbi:SRPBCC domain-containing protein [Nocardioides sp. AE5]|uniref:SRPBCC domain-containing protein n=1 Tax=Nocardioides sp. AE5 TaxID=2962573 RepID=UPI002880E4AF|nr:SRPBCC domain-containing protein [Nocardioides sp. AE5]MDT0200715.1 SRPBCC domain-containing protein [Nocardioides sp. AE5]
MGHRNPEAQAEIDAPLETVWQVMLDVDAYGEWNPFVVKAECPTPPAVGDPILLHVVWANGKGVTSPERIKQVDGPVTDAAGTTRATLAYVYEGLPAKLGLVRGTRYQRLVQEPGGPTTYTTAEEFSGPLVKLAGPGRVAEGFARHARALKERAESLAG